MSLVYEALQKAEREKERKLGSAPAPAPVIQAKPEPQPVVTKPARNYFPALIVCVSIVALAAIIYIVAVTAKNFTEQRPPPSPATPVASQPADLPEPVTPTAPVNSTANDPRFKLTGIMKMGESFGAVINGHIVYDSQYVDGAIVKKVERDRVLLNVDGREIVVRLF
ncbi:MAG: hypothetical protein WCS70_02770 [Verrucomicrobiota bacterium]